MNKETSRVNELSIEQKNKIKELYSNGEISEFAYEEIMKDIDELTSNVYKTGKFNERDRVIRIMEDDWFRGTVARRIIDDIIDQIRGVNKE